MKIRLKRPKYNKERQKNYNQKVHINATFEEAIQVIVGNKTPTKDMLK